MGERRRTEDEQGWDDVFAIWVIILSLVVAIPYALLIKPIMDFAQYLCNPTEKK